MIKAKRIEYMCSYCGKKVMCPTTYGRPQPGECPRKTRLPNGKMRPHTWVISRKLDWYGGI